MVGMLQELIALSYLWCTCTLFITVHIVAWSTYMYLPLYLQLILVAAGVHVGDWSEAESVPGGGSGGFPLVVFDKKMENAVVMAPASQFMAASQGVWKGMNGSSYLGFGLLGSLTKVREDNAW